MKRLAALAALLAVAGCAHGGPLGAARHEIGTRGGLAATSSVLSIVGTVFRWDLQLAKWILGPAPAEPTP